MERRPSRARSAGFVAALGLLVGVVVAAAAAGAGVVGCRAGDPECLALTRTLSLRVGLVAGAASMVMLLVVAGLLRMVSHDEERRARTAGSPWE